MANKSIKNSLRYFIELSYNGTAYHGWQNQPNAITVQEMLEKALSTILGKTIEIIGAGRTDTGVHATQMFAHFDSETILDTGNLSYRLNSFLPHDIAIHQIFRVKEDAHARFDATKRSYLYRIALKKNPFSIESAYFFRHNLNVEVMNEACKILFDYRDFQCFSKSNTDVKTYHCSIENAVWKQVGEELHFEISADRFLRNMVRAIVGTMIEIGWGRLQVADLHNIIKSKSRSQAGYSVPAHGLYLTQVEYPETIKQHG